MPAYGLLHSLHLLPPGDRALLFSPADSSPTVTDKRPGSGPRIFDDIDGLLLSRFPICLSSLAPTCMQKKREILATACFSALAVAATRHCRWSEYKKK